MQQKLPAWQPVFTAKSILPFFFTIGILFLAIGLSVFFSTKNLLEFKVDYTNCQNDQGIECKDILKYDNDTLQSLCQCEVVIEIEEIMEAPIYLYYGLTNFYQNHRRYVSSKDYGQLLGDVEKVPSEDCYPFDEIDSKPIVPCGAIANSLFSGNYSKASLVDSNWNVRVYLLPDRITLFDPNGLEIKMNRTGIAWPSDKNHKFKNPQVPDGYDSLAAYLRNVTSKPKRWIKNLWELDLENENNNGLQNEDLIVWMRTAAFPNFRKLHRIIESDLSPGNYTFDIEYCKSNGFVIGNENSKFCNFQTLMLLHSRVPKVLFWLKSQIH